MNLTDDDQLSTCSREKPVKQSLELNIYKRNEGNSDIYEKTKRTKPSNKCIDHDGKDLLSAIESYHSGLASLQKPKSKRYRIKCDELSRVLESDVDHSPVRNVGGEKHEQSPSKQQLQGVNKRRNEEHVSNRVAKKHRRDIKIYGSWQGGIYSN